MFAVRDIQCRRIKSLTMALTAGLFWIAHLSSVYAHTLYVTDDVHVDMTNGAANFGSHPKLIVQNAGEDNRKEKDRHENQWRRNNDKASYVGFSLVTLPKLTEATDIEKATLRIWVDKVIIPGPVDVQLVNSPWDENLLTGATVPSTGYVDTLYLTAADEGRF